MLNVEKYKKEILDITEGGYYFAVSKDRQNIARSCNGLKCENCIFDEEDDHDCGCNFSRMKWMLSEYKEPIKLTRLEHEILKWLIGKDYKYIVRDSGGWLYADYKQPHKNNRIWGSVNGNQFSMCGFSALFQFIKWEDEEPTSIQDVLENCVVKEIEEE
jgi:hypothetical protein